MVAGIPGITASSSSGALAALGAAPAVATAPAEAVVDDRLPALMRRDLRARKALRFIEAGSLVQEAEKIKAKEERKIIAGYASGRKALQQQKAQQPVRLQREL